LRRELTPVSAAVQGLWVEGPLSPLERLSIRSFLAQGHEYHLFTYGEVPDLPAGAQRREAAEILPADEIFRYEDAESRGGLGGFANLFRYKLLHDRGGWWADLDVVCLRRLDFADDWVFASERLQQGGTIASNAVIRALPGSALLGDCFERGRTDENRAQRFGAIGPKFFDAAISRHGLSRYLRPPEVFCPVDWWRSESFLSPLELPVEAAGVHLWGEMWRWLGWPRDPAAAPDSLYARLHRLYPP
jgi:hypothetical protein